MALFSRLSGLTTAFLQVGLGAAAQSGVIRMLNNTAIMARNPANNADRSLITLNGSDQVQVGDSAATATMVVRNGSHINIDCGDFNSGASINLIPGGSSAGVSVANAPLTTVARQLRVQAATTATFAADGSTDVVICRRVGTIAVTLPTPVATGRRVIVTDAGGNASTNNITITPASGTISGGASYVLNLNHASVTLVWDATNTDWIVVAAYNGTAV